MRQPKWLDHAWADFGQREVAGAGDNPRIVKYYADVGFADVRHDEVAWCAAFVGACLERAGLRSTRLLLARSYLTFAAKLEHGQPGAIVVLSRGADPTLGHVGFWVGETATSVYLLGGNQGDAVSVAAYDKSRVLGMRWPEPIPATMSDQPGPAGDAFAAALAHVLEMEGGWTDDPHDPGGPTQQGITLATYAAWRGATLEAGSTLRLTAELQAIEPRVVREIYQQRYWQPSRAGAMPPALALMHFDATVNHGVTGAARMLQEALDVAVDGEIGPLTLAAVAACAPQRVIADYADIRRRTYRSLAHFWRFGRGWLARVDATEKLALTLPGTLPPKLSATTKGTTDMTEPNDTTSAPGKWWGESLTIWGVIITTLSTVLPVVGPLFGFDISAEVIRQIGEQATHVAQAIGGLIGTLLTIYGRSKAIAPLVRREMLVRL